MKRSLRHFASGQEEGGRQALKMVRQPTVRVLLLVIVRLEPSVNSNVPVPSHDVITMMVVVLVNVHVAAGRGVRWSEESGIEGNLREFKGIAGNLGECKGI